MFKVTVLLSTFNGEKYLREQIDSVLNQQMIDVDILARDDGSNDSTISILNEYEKKYSNFKYYQNENLGPARSFLDLICNASTDSEYYAFCDQDDVWDSDKLYCAVEMLSKLSNLTPNLYYSNLRIVDQDLKFYRVSHEKPLYSKNKYSALTENLCTGCTAVFNRCAMQMVRNNIPEYCTMHDTWLYMLCKLLGNTIYDEKPHIAYRQHQNNVVGAYLKKNRAELYKERFFRLFQKDLQPRYINALNFETSFGKYMEQGDREKVLEIVQYKDNLRNRLKLFFDRDVSASTFYGNVRFRLHILWGTV